MNDENVKTMKELIDEHGKEARDRWREVFDETRARGADVVTATTYADDTVRAEVERGVLVPCARVALDRRVRSFVLAIDAHRSRDGKTIDPDWIQNIATHAHELAMELRS